MWYGGYTCAGCGAWVTGTSHFCGSLSQIETTAGELRIAAALERIAYALENLVTIMSNEDQNDG